MMQNVAPEENNSSNKEIKTVEIEHGSQTGSYPSIEKSETLPTSQSTFGPDISDDDEVSDVSRNASRSVLIVLLHLCKMFVQLFPNISWHSKVG